MFKGDWETMEGPFVIPWNMLDNYGTEENFPSNSKPQKVSGNGQCPVLPQTLLGSVPQVKFWRGGMLVTGKGRRHVKRGTVIATFDENSRYANNKHGNHAAVYLSSALYNGFDGIWVIDQWVGKGSASIRHIQIKLGSLDDPSNDARAFSVVLAVPKSERK